ncbi:MAG: RNase adapter RapZ [Firmicutes bacterium]|nr:RNase adapter RapZ [Bacillota bacterium]MDD7602951.1 RNase adapter RapZ [Bacillota bacterium]MDY5856904.1 RNase adapter RapZ [Anaerovoracaceae bacterium]
MEVVIITGLSGAGKTKAADWFEDRDYYCIDNMPPALIKNFIDLALSGNSEITKAAFVIDIRGGQFLGGIGDIVGALASDRNLDFKILYIEASDETLIRRYKENRRVHPLSMAPISREIIAKEREMLSGLRSQATYIIDTSFLKVAEFNAQLDNLFNDGKEQDSFLIDIQSFGFKKGVPQEADIVMDVRFIPNPYYVPSLKNLTGNNKKVAQYVLKHRVTKEFIDSLHTMLARLIPCYIKEGKYSLRIAFGCTGGHHRSVAVANEMARIFREEGRRVTLEHRDL